MLKPRGTRQPTPTQRLAIRRLPPSWNETKRSSAKRRRRHREDVRAFIDEVVAAAAEQTITPFTHSVLLEIWLFFGPDDDGDTDNRIIKVLQDALERSGYFKDDVVVDEIRVRRVFCLADRPHKTLVRLSQAACVTETQALEAFDACGQP